MKRSHPRAIGSTEAQVHATRRQRIVPLDGDGELDAEGACHRAIVGAALLEVHDPTDPQGPQCCVIEPAAALQVSYAQRNVVDHLCSPSAAIIPEAAAGRRTTRARAT